MSTFETQIQTLYVPEDFLVETKRNPMNVSLRTKPTNDNFGVSEGVNNSIQTIPKTLIFDKFKLNKIYKKRLRIVNKSSAKLRVQYSCENTKNFTFNFTKSGYIYPGMTETLEVLFCPEEFRFYYNEVKVQTSQGDDLVVPIYSYPSISDFKFPKFVDFGICPLDSIQTKEFTISSQADIPFEFKIETDGIRPEFSVTPTEGTISGGQELSFLFKFHPVTYTTSKTTIKFRISQFGFDPLICSLQGSCQPFIVGSKSTYSINPDLKASNSSTNPSTFPRHQNRSKVKKESKSNSKNDTVPESKPFCRPPLYYNFSKLKSDTNFGDMMAWDHRKYVSKKFVEAIRKVILQIRMTKILSPQSQTEAQSQSQTESRDQGQDKSSEEVKEPILESKEVPVERLKSSSSRHPSPTPPSNPKVTGEHDSLELSVIKPLQSSNTAIRNARIPKARITKIAEFKNNQKKTEKLATEETDDSHDISMKSELFCGFLHNPLHVLAEHERDNARNEITNINYNPFLKDLEKRGNYSVVESGVSFPFYHVLKQSGPNIKYMESIMKENNKMVSGLSSSEVKTERPFLLEILRQNQLQSKQPNESSSKD